MIMFKKGFEAKGLPLTREICLAFKVSQSMNFLKHLQSHSFLFFYLTLYAQNLWNLLFLFLKKENYFHNFAQMEKYTSRAWKRGTENFTPHYSIPFV